jgi:hypothetical protein
MRSIFGPVIEHLDLEGVYITEATIKLVASRCPHLKFLNLKDSGFIMTDHLIQILLKVIKFRKSPEEKVYHVDCDNVGNVPARLPEPGSKLY